MAREKPLCPRNECDNLHDTRAGETRPRARASEASRAAHCREVAFLARLQAVAKAAPAFVAATLDLRALDPDADQPRARAFALAAVRAARCFFRARRAPLWGCWTVEAGHVRTRPHSWHVHLVIGCSPPLAPLRDEVEAEAGRGLPPHALWFTGRNHIVVGERAKLSALSYAAKAASALAHHGERAAPVHGRALGLLRPRGEEMPGRSRSPGRVPPVAEGESRARPPDAPRSCSGTDRELLGLSGLSEGCADAADAAAIEAPKRRAPRARGWPEHRAPGEPQRAGGAPRRAGQGAAAAPHRPPSFPGQSAPPPAEASRLSPPAWPPSSASSPSPLCCRRTT